MKAYHNLYPQVYAFKNLYLAFLKARKYKTQTKEAIEADPKDYYPQVNHAILISLIEKRIKDANIIWLIKRFLKNHSQSGKGISMGGPLHRFMPLIVPMGTFSQKQGCGKATRALRSAWQYPFVYQNY